VLSETELSDAPVSKGFSILSVEFMLCHLTDPVKLAVIKRKISGGYVIFLAFIEASGT
jgi:hypothetical protein